MNFLRRVEPTPSALRLGRIVLAVTIAIWAVFAAITLFIPGFADANLVALLLAAAVAIAGDSIAYLGQPSVTRHRVGRVVSVVGIISGFVLLVARPFA